MKELKGYADADLAIGRYNILLLISGWISAVLSLFLYPFIFGVFGVVMGILGTTSRSRSGIFLITSSIFFMAVGLIFHDLLSGYAQSMISLFF